MNELNVGLFNDSFPPMIDGVANTVLNYAQSISKGGGRAVVATPWYPKVRDEYPFEVLRYPSAYISRQLGYRAGLPFDPRIVVKLQRSRLDILHSHCPFISTILTREVRFRTGAPIVFTYHTKFDIDIEKRVALNPVRSASIRFILANINACDEVWVVSKGAGENLRGLGYQGDFVLMENGTDFQKGRAPREAVEAVSRLHGLADGEAVFLFVGRMMWYKGVRLSIDGLRLAAQAGHKFKMLFIGDGIDRPEIERYTRDCGLGDRCIFTGAIRDRELLRAYFSRATLFLFPSTYDTNGIVVKEAAACSCPSLLLAGSCAAEGVLDGDTGLLIREEAREMARAVADACRNRPRMREIGQNAADRLYLSWDDAVARACRRYGAVLENYRSKNDAPSKNEIFFENVQRIRDDLTLKTEQLAGAYRSAGVRLKRRIAYHSADMRMRSLRACRLAGVRLKRKLAGLRDDPPRGE